MTYHVTQSGIDTTLSGDGVGTSREELGNDGGLEALRTDGRRGEREYIFRKTHSSTKTSTTSTNNNTIIFMID